MVYDPLLANGYMEGASLQVNSPALVHDVVVEWRERSAALGRPWYMGSDETGPPNVGVAPDSVDPTHDGPRKGALWGNLMGGGAGCQWYFGYGYAHNDLDCENFRSRENMWSQTRIALDFMRTSCSAPIMLCVCSVSGQCALT